MNRLLITPNQTRRKTYQRRRADRIHCAADIQPSQHGQRGMVMGGIASWSWDLVSNRITADATMVALTGFDQQALSDPVKFLRSIHGADRRVVQCAVQTALQAGTDLHIEFRFTPSDGRQLWLAVRGGAVRNTRGDVVALCGVVFDITERKSVELKLLAAKEALEQSNRAKDVFIAKLAHEVRTPLTAVLGFAELLEDRLQDADDRSDLARIVQNGKYLQALVDDMLDLSRVVADKVRINLKKVDLPALLQEMSATLERRAEAKGLTLIFDIPPTLPCEITSDSMRLRQILYNLIGNAIKFTRQGEVRVSIRSEGQGSDATLLFSVCDSGPGISEEEVRRIFQPFMQAQSGRTERNDGLGLGLAISDRLAHMLGGAISVDSRLGSGSTFTLRLPLRAGAQSAQPQTSSPRPVPSRQLAARVLVVDDVESNQRLLSRQIAAADAEVTTAGTGYQAISAAMEAQRQGRPYDLILLDLWMPELNGYETLRRLREAGIETPAIAFTAGVTPGEREKCLFNGFADFLPKPFATETLVTAATRAMVNHRSERTREALPSQPWQQCREEEFTQGSAPPG